MNATPSVQVFMTQLARIVAALLGSHAHAQIIIIVKDGALMPVHINQTYLPGDLPKV